MAVRIGILGAGAWGTAIGKVLADRGQPVHLWSFEAEVAADINERHQNCTYLPGAILPPLVQASTDIVSVAEGCDHLIMAIPSLYLLAGLKRVLGCATVREGRSIISILTKGFIETPAGIKLITEAMEDYLPGMYRGKLVYVSGPSHAIEVAQGKLTGLISASRSGRNSIRVRELLSGGSLVVFSSLDVRGVQVSAALKNVVALAFGMLDALKESSDRFGDNTESLLLAAGLNEIQAAGRSMGATHAETFTSIAGVGDLDVTCRSLHGRNRRFGREVILKGLIDSCSSIDEVISRLPSFGYIAEGVVTAKWVHALAERKRLVLPIISGVYRILNREAAPLEELGAVMDGIISRSRNGRRRRSPSALLRGTAEWTRDHLAFGKRQ
ncbi:MAG TPA: NAD(P)H-dependent glycerol-3-phosphate dehydrogenase [bacterium]|nr:NAD(P)H-dependent glycerol-3-phosphate dehydrogenase [bacterium]